uniref:LINE-1 reverse transcriptase isogeny n=1 Tax=Cajanus cajan TaxID=3821 RepID=A0A151TYJ6_CAJCA|nr:LINE-1 reverse transcriptase isogeny [Cajanus cajan]
MVTEFYKQLFEDPGGYEPYCLSNSFPELSPKDRSMLSTPITQLEIVEALKRMGGLKAPGPDGFQALFFQTQWSTVGTTMCKLLQDIFKNPRKVAEMNKTFITLIPKVENVSSLKQMRPISLCNVSYKLLTKAIAFRLRNIMVDLVGPNQCNFVPNRHTSDNIIITQEVIHSMSYKTGKKGWMAIKIDLEKAYDRLNWTFIKETLTMIGIPLNLVELIWHCISSSSMQVLWNGETLPEFKPTRGIRQGDPLSPYIFVLCMERLFHLIEVAVCQELWKPIKQSKKGPAISHLAFADNLILFAEASLDQAEIIKSCLDSFCLSSGMKVSEENTRVFFSKNVGWNVKSEISSSLGFQRTDNLGKYLGVQLHHTRVSRNSFQSVMNSINRRISSWKAKTLSFAGRLTLTKSVLAALPSYTMQTVFLPRQLCDEIDKASRSFLWGDSRAHRRVHAIAWETICKPKTVGGLGIREARKINTSFMMKNCWALCSQPNKLWVRVLKAKYDCGEDRVPMINKKTIASNVWRGICDAWKFVQTGIAWNVGDGKTTKFWNERWLPSRVILLEAVITLVPRHFLDQVVAEYVDEGGNWKLNMLQHLLPDSILQEILAVAPPSEKNDVDVLCGEEPKTVVFQ